MGWLWLALGGVALATILLPVGWLEPVIGGALALGGGGQAFLASRLRGRAAFWPLLIGSLGALAAGGILLAQPLGGRLPLVLMLLFALQAGCAFWLAAGQRSRSWSLLTSAMLSLLLGLAILGGWFCGAYPWLGVALGVERLVAGLTLRGQG
jgi:uncharacterized membrane protein HdeD (DUF308 family)